MARKQHAMRKRRPETTKRGLPPGVPLPGNRPLREVDGLRQFANDLREIAKYFQSVEMQKNSPGFSLATRLPYRLYPKV
jgi:hypothetical protein